MRGFLYGGGLKMFKSDELYTAYSQAADITFIMRDTFGLTGELESTGVIGWYYGPPDPNNTREFSGKLVAYYG